MTTSRAPHRGPARRPGAAALAWAAACVLVAGSLGACGGTTQTATISIPAPTSNPDAAARELERRLEREGPSAELYGRLAAARLAAGQPAVASTLVARALALDSRHAGALVVAARVASASGDGAAAVRHYEAAADTLGPPGAALPEALAREWAQALVALAEERLAAGRPGDADTALRALVTRLPAQAEELRARRGAVARGVVEGFLRQGRGGPAEAALGVARAAGVEPAELQLAAARAADLLGRRDKAAALFRGWAAAEDSARRWVRVAEHYEGADAPAEALDAYRQAAAQEGVGEDALTALGRSALRQDQPDEAEAAFRRAAGLRADGPGRARVLSAGAEALRGAGKRAQALAMFNDAVDAAPGDPDVVRGFAEYLGHLGQRDRLQALLVRYMEERGATAEVVREAAELLVRAGAVDAAVQVLEGAASRGGAEPGLWLDLARALDRRRSLRVRRDEAVEAFEQAVGDDPEQLVLAARTWLDFHSVARARSVVQRVLRLQPGNLEAGLLAADVLVVSGRPLDEARALERLLDEAVDPALAALRIGERWQTRRKPTEALPWLRKALELAPVEGVSLRRRIHGALYEAYLTGRPTDDAAAGAHMRAWLAAGEPASRAADLERLLTRAVGVAGLISLRLEVLEELVALQPERLELVEALGRQLLTLKDYRRAQAFFQSLVERSAEPAIDAQRLGRLLFDEGQLDQALALYDRVEPGRIEQPRVLRVLGEHLARRGLDERADAMFRLFLAAADEPQHRSELTIFMRTAIKLRRWELAQQAARQVLGRSEDNREAALVFGEAALALGDDEEAREWLARAMTGMSPGQRAKAALAAGAVMERRGRLEMAAGAYEVAIDEGGVLEAQGAFDKLADVQRRRQDKVGLQRAVQLLVGKSPHERDEVRAVRKAVAALDAAGLGDEAAALVERTLTRHANDSALLDVAVRAALGRGDMARALELLQRSAQLQGNTARAWEEVARTLVDAGHAEAAEQLLASKLEGSADPALQLVYGKRLLAAGRYDEAERAFLQALSQSFSAREIVAGVDEAYREVGQYTRLRTFHARAGALAPTRSEHTLALGRVALEEGDVSTARQALTRYLALNERGHLDVAKAWAGAGWVDEALAHYRRAWEQASRGQDDLPLSAVVDLLVTHGRTSEVEELTQRHLRRARDDVKALEQVALAFEHAGDIERALHWSRRADELHPASERALDRARLQMLLGDVGAARAELLAYVHRKAEEGVDGRRVAQERDRGSLRDAVSRAGRLLAAHLRPEVGLELVREVLGSYGDDPALRVIEAWLRVEAGDTDGAVAGLEGAGTQLRVAGAEGVALLVGALVDRDRLDEAADLLGEGQVVSWSKDLAVVRLSLLVRRGRWGLADAQAGELLMQGDAELATRAGWAAFDGGYYDLADRIVRHVALDPSGQDQSRSVVALAAALDALRARSPRGERAATGVAWGAASEDRLGALTAAAFALSDAGDARGGYDAAMKALAGSPGDPELLRLAVDCAALLPDGHPELLAALGLATSGGRPAVRSMREAKGWLQAEGRWDLALTLNEQLMALEPGLLSRRLESMELALGAGDDAAAARHALAAAELGGGEPRTLLALARIWADWMDPVRARALLDKLASVHGELALERELVSARVAVVEGDTAGVIAATDRAVGAAPDPATARLRGAALLLEVAAQPGAALALLEPLISESGAGAAHLSLAAQAAWRVGRLDEARRYLAALDKRRPGAWSRPQLLAAAVAGGDLEGVQALVDSLLVAGLFPTPRTAVASVLVQAIEAETQDWSPEQRGPLLDLAEALVGQAASVISSDSMTASLAIIEELRGNLDGAIGAYELAMVRAPTTAGHANNLAYALSRHGLHLERALELVRGALLRAGRPEASYLDTEAWVLHALGRGAEALPIMRRVMQLASDRQLADPESMVELLFHVASIQEAVGDRAGARATWRDCARRAPSTLYGSQCVTRWRALASASP